MAMPAMVPPNVANMLMPMAFTFRLQNAVGCAPKVSPPPPLTRERTPLPRTSDRVPSSPLVRRDNATSQTHSAIQSANL